MTIAFVADARAFKAALRTVCRVVPKRNSIPILRHVLIEPNRLVGTDMDMELSIDFPSEIVSDGQVCVPADGLASLLPSSGRLGFRQDGFLLLIEPEGSAQRFALKCGPVADFPFMKKREMPTTLGGTGVAAAFARLYHAISTEETRYYLNGICVRAFLDRTELVATDGHRLGKLSLPPARMLESSIPAVIVPRDTVKLVMALGDPETVHFGNQIMFEGKGWLLRSKLIDGTFPDYDRCIPDSNPKTVVFDAPTLAAALPKILGTHAVRLTIEDDQIIVSYISPDIDYTSKTQAPCQYHGEPIDIGFNLRFLRELLSQMLGEVSAEFNGVADPVVFKTPDFLYVLMPMRF